MNRYFALTALALFAAHLHGGQRFLCEADEQLVFGCSLGGQQLSLCASSTLTADSGYLQYRLGMPGRFEQVYPRQPLPPHDRFFLSTAAYAGGGASAIRFRIDGTDHFVFERMRRTNFAPGEPHDAEFLAGLAVRREDAVTSTVLCEENDASIRKVAYDHLPREEYDLEIVP